MSSSPFDQMFEGLTLEDKDETTDVATASSSPGGDAAASVKSATPDRSRFTVYANRSSHDRIKLWSEHLGVPQVELIERAWERYCDELADKFNNGEDPVRADVDDKLSELP